MTRIIENFKQIKIACNTCKFYTDSGNCKAFPKGIPSSVLLGDKHDKPLPGQENLIVYEELPFDNLGKPKDNA